MASVSFKEAIAFDLPNHVSGIAIGERRNAKSHVAEDLHAAAAEAEGDERAEERVPSAGKHLAVMCQAPVRKTDQTVLWLECD